MSLLLLNASRGVRAAPSEPPLGGPSITGAITEASRNITQGSTTTFTLPITRTDYTGTVTPTAESLPSGVSASFSPATYTGGTLSVTMTLTATGGAALITDDSITVRWAGAGVSDVTDTALLTVAEASLFGAGPNAEAWASKTIYTDQKFAAPIPFTGGTADAAGFYGNQGFSSGWASGPRVEYPVVSTPFGEKEVLRIYYRGQTESLSALNAATTPWEVGNDEFNWQTIFVQGTWEGTLSFEESTDGGETWSAITCYAEVIDFGGDYHVSGSSSTVNGLWLIQGTVPSVITLFRAIFSSYTSGTAEVRVGNAGGQSPARFFAGGFEAGQSKIYLRHVWRISSNWTNGGNTGTKQIFINGGDYLGGDFNPQFMGVQGPSENFPGTAPGTPPGEYYDCEYLYTAGTPGGRDGTFKAWINGVLLNDASDVPWFLTGETPEFTGLYYDPTYGGGRRPPPADQFYEIAYMYRESAP